MDSFNSYVLIKIEGKDINRFIKSLYKKNIDLVNIKYLNDHSCLIKMSLSDYQIFKAVKTIYKHKVIKKYGLYNIVNNILTNKYIIISIVVSYVFLMLLSNLIFKVTIIHSNKSLRDMLNKELKSYNISKYKFIKDYNSLENIQKNILNNNKDKLEWIEITRIGTSYYIRAEERILKKEESSDDIKNIVAKKSGIIKDIYAENGTIVKNVNDYVSKGDIIISSEIKLNEEVKDIVSAKGTIYAEVWYNVSVSYPLHYKEITYTGRTKKTLSFKFLSKNFDLDLNPYKEKVIEDKEIFKNNILPISLSFVKFSEVNKIDEIYTYEEAINKGVLLARQKVLENLKEKEYIISEKTLKKTEKDSTIELDIFFKVYEDITDYILVENIE